MVKQLPLTRVRLYEILGRFEPDVSMVTKGGYDIGYWFSFSGRLSSPYNPEDRIAGGRLITPFGFCSESMMMTRAEQFSRGGIRFGIALLESRVEVREKQLSRWLAEYQSKDKKD